MDWKKICTMMRHADRQNEMAYQKYIKDVILEVGLGWSEDQITEQMSLQLGATERLVPDLLVSKDNNNSFVIEVKKPGHKKTNGDIAQLVSYMKQFETPVGIYWGDELEVYYKTLGDGSDPILLMNLRFKESEEDGSRFIALFSECNFCIDIVREFKQERVAKLLFESSVKELTAEVTSADFAQEVKSLIKQHLRAKALDQEVIATVMENVSVDISLHYDSESDGEDNYNNSVSPVEDSYIKVGRRGIVGRYAYNLIRQIIEKNSTLNFDQMFAIFGKKNRIEKVSLITDKKRWFMDERDLITLSDGTKIAVSTQWGLNGASKPNMDNLREVAQRFGIDTSLPF